MLYNNIKSMNIQCENGTFQLSGVENVHIKYNQHQYCIGVVAKSINITIIYRN